MQLLGEKAGNSSFQLFDLVQNRFPIFGSRNHVRYETWNFNFIFYFLFLSSLNGLWIGCVSWLSEKKQLNFTMSSFTHKLLLLFWFMNWINEELEKVRHFLQEISDSEKSDLFICYYPTCIRFKSVMSFQLSMKESMTLRSWKS